MALDGAGRRRSVAEPKNGRGQVVEHFDIIVIGAGMMGSAAARHLALTGAKVALVGPDEPEDKAAHGGVFASHYDAARVTRQIDTRPNWARFSQAAIARYAELEKAGGERFFHPVGTVVAGPEDGPASSFVCDARANAVADGVPFEALRGDDLRSRFPEFQFPAGVLALYEPAGAGWIDPRAHVRAEIAAAAAHGATVHRAEVARLDQGKGMVTAHCADGTVFSARKAIVACGPFSKAAGLLPHPLPMRVYARTVAFFELAQAEATRLSHMPSLIYVPPDGATDPYILPPVRYPDGKVYIKIGGDPDDHELATTAEMKAWFRTKGDAKAGEVIADQLLRLMPDLSYEGITFGACATSFSPHGNPFIYHQTEAVMALTAGNGAAAKCADEIGRLGALVALGDAIPDIYAGPFDASAAAARVVPERRGG